MNFLHRDDCLAVGHMLFDSHKAFLDNNDMFGKTDASFEKIVQTANQWYIYVSKKHTLKSFLAANRFVETKR
jgi:hypothetical protein